MSPQRITPESASATAQIGSVPRLKVIAAADPNDVMREQLEFLIEHAEAGDCGCAQCERYARARALLLQAFAETPARPRAVAA